MPGERLYFGGVSPRGVNLGGVIPAGPDTCAPLLEAEVLTRGEFGERTLRFEPVPDFFARFATGAGWSPGR